MPSSVVSVYNLTAHKCQTMKTINEFVFYFKYSIILSELDLVNLGMISCVC